MLFAVCAFFFHQAVDVGLKTGALGVKFASEL
jgi:hypothetical protein